MFKRIVPFLALPLLISTLASADAKPLSSKSDFETNVLKSTVPVIVDVWSPECPACRKFKPTFERVAKGSLGKSIGFYTLNFLESDELMSIIDAYHVDRIPARLYFSQGNMIAHETGNISEAKFVGEIRAKLGL